MRCNEPYDPAVENLRALVCVGSRHAMREAVQHLGAALKLDPLESLVEAMQRLLREPHTAQAWGAAAKDRAQSRFGITRFVSDWQAALAAACERHERRRA